MNASIAQLETYLEILKNNEPINRREGDIEQDDLNLVAIKRLEEAKARGVKKLESILKTALLEIDNER